MDSRRVLVNSQHGIMMLQIFWLNNQVAQWLVKNFSGKRLSAFGLFLDEESIKAWDAQLTTVRLHF